MWVLIVLSATIRRYAVAEQRPKSKSAVILEDLSRCPESEARWHAIQSPCTVSPTISVVSNRR